MSASNEERECPLCLEALELDDLNFFPCTCGYQICRFCWHRIRTNENGLCPACRKQYSEDPANFKPLSVEELQRIKNEKKQKDLQRKQKISENRKHLANVRVVQKNLVFVVGLPTRLADPEELKKPSYFGKFGKIVKVIVNTSTSYAGSQGPSASAYVTYQKVEDALRAIQAVNNSKVDGRTLKASLGTTKYCSNFLKKLQCPKQDCMYLHELGDEAASFTKEDMQAGLHQEYENKLHEQMLANEAANRKQQSSPVDNSCSTTQVFSKEKWPSKKDQLNTQAVGHYTGSPQFDKSPSDSASENSPEPERKNDTCTNCEPCSTEEISEEVELKNTNCSNNTVIESSEYLQGQNNVDSSDSVNSVLWHNSFTDMPTAFRPSESYQHSTNPTQKQSKLPSYENHFISRHSEAAVPQEIPNGFPSRCQPMSPEQYDPKPAMVHHSGLTNGFPHDPLQKTVIRPSYSWMNGQSKDCFKSMLSENYQNGSSDGLSSFFNNSAAKISSTSFSGSRNNIPLSLYSGVQSIHEGLSHVQNSMIMLSHNNSKGLYSPSESSLANHDDDLGFDPWHESAKGLADLMLKEADERAKANGVVFNRSANLVRRTVVPNESMARSNHLPELSRYAQRQTVPPPGFSMQNCGVGSLPRPLFGEPFHSNKTLPVMNTYNQSPSAQVTHYQQNMPVQNGFAFNHMFNSRESEVRPQTHDWQESFANLQQRNVDVGYNAISHQLPNHMGRNSSSSSSWSNTSLSEMLWQQQEQNVSQARNINSVQVDKMLQQLKLNDQAGRLQNHMKYTPFAAYKGSSS